jgi:peptidoglycan/LPS O-acetylase OafA/YrhL
MPSRDTVQLNSARRYAHVDAMRAFAVMLVVVAHAGLGHVVPGGSGVTMFFAISGYIITSLLLRERDRTGAFDARDFYFRRAAKLAPPFTIFVIVPSLLAIAAGANLVGGLAAETFFAYNWALLGANPPVLPGTGVTWSLAIEEQFYIAFAILWLLAVRSKNWERMVVVVGVIAVVAPTVLRVIFALSEGDVTDRIYYGTDTRLDAIALGVLLAFWLRRQRQIRNERLAHITGSSWFFAAAVVVYLATLLLRDPFFRDTFRYTLQAIAACAIIAWGFGASSDRFRAIVERVIGLRLVQFLGLASYSIYLAHLVVISLLSPALSAVPAAPRMALLIVAGTAVGCACYVLVEKPVHRFVRRRAEARAA